MTGIEQHDVHNMLLARLPATAYRRLQPHLARVPHCNGDVFAAPGRRLETVRFPEGAVAALLTVMRDGTRLAVGLIGREGLIGASLLHGAREWRHEVLVRAADSTALEITADRLLDSCRDCPALHDLLLRFAGYFIQQVGRTSVANLVAPLERRMARWILLYHDRIDGDEVLMTHQEIGIMLGVRRSSATDILHILEGTRAIRNRRGCIEIRDRTALEEIAGEVYGDAEADYREMIGPFGKSRVNQTDDRPPTGIAMAGLVTSG